MEDDKLKVNLVALLHFFKDKPNLLVNFLLEYEALKKDFKDRISSNDKLDKIYESYYNKEEIDEPYFKDVEDMQEFYKQLFEKRKKKNQNHVLITSTNSKEVLNKQLEEAVEIEDYEKAAKIRDYMISIGYFK